MSSWHIDVSKSLFCGGHGGRIHGQSVRMMDLTTLTSKEIAKDQISVVPVAYNWKTSMVSDRQTDTCGWTDEWIDK